MDSAFPWLPLNSVWGVNLVQKGVVLNVLEVYAG